MSGTVKSDGQSLTFDAIKGKIGGGEATASIDARQGANGIALNARVQFSGVDGAALRYRDLAMPAGRASMQMTLASQGRSASALTGALSGSGTVTLESAEDRRSRSARLRSRDPRQRQRTGDGRRRGCSRSSSPRCRPARCRSPRRKFRSTSGTAGFASARPRSMPMASRAIVSGGYDIPADQADIRASARLTVAGSATGRPEIQLFAVGTPDALDRTVDVAALSSWLAVRAIDHETRRLDAIERGEPPPPMPAPVIAAGGCATSPSGGDDRRANR